MNGEGSMFPHGVHELVILLTERKQKTQPSRRFKRAVTALQILENESIGSEGKGIRRLGAGRGSRKSSNSNWKKEKAGHVLSIVGKDSLIPYRTVRKTIKVTDYWQRHTMRPMMALHHLCRFWDYWPCATGVGCHLYQRGLGWQLPRRPSTTS